LIISSPTPCRLWARPTNQLPQFKASQSPQRQAHQLPQWQVHQLKACQLRQAKAHQRRAHQLASRARKWSIRVRLN
jgi:hypothetical protein